MKKILSSVIFGLAVISLVTPRQADAIPTLYLSDGTTNVTVTDELAGDLDSGIPGMVGFSGPVGNWIANVETGFTKPLFGSPGAPHLNLTSNNFKSTGSSTLTIKFSETNFTSVAPGWIASLTGGQTTGTVRYQTYLDNGNAIFGTTTPLLDSGSLGSLGPNYFNTCSCVSDGSFSLTQVITLSSSGGTFKNFNADLLQPVQPVPEPASLLLLGSGLMGLSGFGFWRRKNTQA